ncbi:hypothetical protein D3C87_101810 [compost metagenome]
MLKSGFKIVFIIMAAFLLHKAAFAADVIELPPEELAQESVLPIFDKSVSVKNRNIITAKKFDANLFYGFAMTEPIADVSKLGLSLYYNWSEDHAIGLLFAKNFSGLSTYADQLSKPPYNLDFNRAPKPDMTVMADYNIKAFYGKMSLSKSLVLNTMLYGSLSAGVVKFDTKTYPGIAFGFGQKFYFNKNWAVRADLRLYANQAPIPFKQGALKPSDPVPDKSTFDERITYTTNLDLGVSYLF